MWKLIDFIKYSKEQADKAALAQMTVGQLVCNSLTVNHYLQIGGFVARYDRACELKDDSIVLTLEEVRK